MGPKRKQMYSPNHDNFGNESATGANSTSDQKGDLSVTGAVSSGQRNLFGEVAKLSEADAGAPARFLGNHRIEHRTMGHGAITVKYLAILSICMITCTILDILV